MPSAPSLRLPFLTKAIASLRRWLLDLPTAWRYPIGLCIVWVLMCLLVNPIGDFPLNDDWAYGQAVKQTIDQHGLRIPGWTSAALAGQILYALVFCVPFGFSFTALRFASLTLGLAAVLATYGLAREARAERRISFVCAAAVAVNPLFLECANTFMTDVPFVGFLMVSMYLAVRALRSGSLLLGGLALVVAVLATLTRQVGLSIPIAMAIGVLLARKATGPRLAAVAVGGVVVFASLKIFEWWLARAGQMSGLYGHQAEILRAALRGLPGTEAWRNEVRDRLCVVLVHLGLALTPLLLVAGPRLRRPNGYIRIVAMLCGLCVAIAVTMSMVGRNSRLPFAEGFNIADVGVGPLTLADTYLLNLRRAHFPHAAPSNWWAVTGVGIAGGAFLVGLLVMGTLDYLRGLIKRERRAGALAPLVAGLFTLAYGPVLALMFIFDRYLIPLLPAVGLVVLLAVRRAPGPMHPDGLSRPAPRHDRLWLGASGLVLTLFAMFSVAATHDYLAWNRARWTGLNYLTGVMKISPDRIDGGFEFNGLNRFGKDAAPGKSWWWVHDDEYMLAFGPVAGFNTFRSYPFLRLIPPSTGRIYVLQRTH